MRNKKIKGSGSSRNHPVQKRRKTPGKEQGLPGGESNQDDSLFALIEDLKKLPD